MLCIWVYKIVILAKAGIQKKENLDSASRSESSLRVAPTSAESPPVTGIFNC